MISEAAVSLRGALSWLFALFALASAFSIAIAQIALGLALICFIVLVVVERYRPFSGPLRLFYVLVGFYVGWLFVSAASGATPVQSTLALREEWLFCIIPIGVYLFQYRRYSERIILALFVGLLAASLSGILQYFTGEDWLLHHDLHPFGASNVRLTGFFSFPLTYANYMIVAAMFAVGYSLASYRRSFGWKRVFMLSVSLLALITSAIANSRGPLLGLGAGLLVLGLLYRKLLYPILAIVAVAAVAIIASPGLSERYFERVYSDIRITNEASRLFIWKTSLKVIRDHPVTGVGPGNFQKEYAARIRDDAGDDLQYKHAHSDVLNVAAIAGIVGLVFFLAVWMAAIRYQWRSYKSGVFSERTRNLGMAAFLASVTFLVCSLSEATFADEEVRQLLMLIWAAGLFGWQKEKGSVETASGGMSS